jgi:hypothetical protein
MRLSKVTRRMVAGSGLNCKGDSYLGAFVSSTVSDSPRSVPVGGLQARHRDTSL